MLQNSCGTCGTKNCENKCRDCNTFYCNTICQQKNWKIHKKVCNLIEHEIGLATTEPPMTRPTPTPIPIPIPKPKPTPTKKQQQTTTKPTKKTQAPQAQAETKKMVMNELSKTVAEMKESMIPLTKEINALFDDTVNNDPNIHDFQIKMLKYNFIQMKNHLNNHFNNPNTPWFDKISNLLRQNDEIIRSSKAEKGMKNIDPNNLIGRILIYKLIKSWLDQIQKDEDLESQKQTENIKTNAYINSPLISAPYYHQLAKYEEIKDLNKINVTQLINQKKILKNNIAKLIRELREFHQAGIGEDPIQKLIIGIGKAIRILKAPIPITRSVDIPDYYTKLVNSYKKIQKYWKKLNDLRQLPFKDEKSNIDTTEEHDSSYFSKISKIAGRIGWSKIKKEELEIPTQTNRMAIQAAVELHDDLPSRRFWQNIVDSFW